MADAFDPYREALVVETKTFWPDSLEEVDVARKQEIAERLHADPAPCAELEYERLATGFCRRITVTRQDIERVAS